MTLIATGPRIKTLYISGPMSGLPEYNKPAFNTAQQRLTAVGFDVLNPARHSVKPHLTWADYMRLALIDLAGAHGVALLHGWENSRGANIEVDIAQSLEIPVFDVMAWLQ